MTQFEAREEVANLAELFPRTNQTHLDFWYDVFQRPQYEQKIVRAAVSKYSEREGSFIDRTKLRAIIETETATATGLGGRLRAEREAHERANREKEQETEKSFAAVNEALDALTPAELEELKKRTVEAHKIVNPAIGKVIEKSDPKTGKLLRCLMANLLAQVDA